MCIHYQHLKNTSNIIPLKQHKFQNREARRKLGGQNRHEQQRKSIPPSFDSSKHGAHTECYKKFTMGLNIAKRKSEGKEHQFLITLRECKDQGNLQNNYFQNTT